ncbi:TRAP transporter small permease [Roseibium polysiphoniae]|uniref:TRAP transporter small permease protein n=1 Tax=Roseibium polysiphoniae TaxID=2571221 RepID=A0A944GQT0_9HYPH|nr:TRAP transporter small permease [Roseibium polysiphoniae]MBS8258817.1 TRAP transporter small permease [Roseibium polysiphoniae]
MTAPGMPQHQIELEEEQIDLSDLRWHDSLVLLVFWLLFSVVFLQFFTRYVLNDSLGWTEEIARYLLIAVTFIGAVMAVRKESMIAVEIFYRWFPRGLRRALQFGVDLVSIIFYGTMAMTCMRLAQRTRQKMVSIEVSKSYVYWGVSICFACMCLLAIWILIKHLRTGSSHLIDPEQPDEPATGSE